MKRSLLFIALATLVSFSISAQGFIRTDGTNLVNDDGKILLRGINLGGWLITEGYIMDYIPSSPTGHNEFWYHHVEDMVGSRANVDYLLNLFRDNFIVEKDIELIAEAGFNHVRVPFMYDLFFNDTTMTPKDEGFKYLDNVIQWAENHGIYVILDLHTAPGGQSSEHHANPESHYWSGNFWGNFPQSKNVCIDIWRRIADRYKDRTTVAGYDLLNEPHEPNPMSNDTTEFKLRQYYMQATAAIREVDQNHVIYTEGNFFGSDIQWLFPVWDDNMAMSIHNYWTCVDRDLSVPPKWYDRGGEPGQIPMALENNVPIWMGEFGENSNNWNHDQVELAESDNVNWCVWTYKKTASSSSMVNQMWTQGIDYCLGANPCSGDTSCNTGNWNYGYWRIKEAWQGKRTKPSEADAMEWFEDWILRGNTNTMGDPNSVAYYNKDFVDALLRPDFDERPKPFNDNQVVPEDPSEKLCMSALDYDLGDNGIGSYDQGIIHKGEDCGGGEPWNEGWQYRNDAVDIKAYWDNHNHHNRDTMVFSIKGGEWLSYTIQFPATGLYTLEVKALGPMGFNVEIDDVDVTGSQTTNGPGDVVVDHCFQPVGGSDIVWTTFTDIPICGGERQVKFKFAGGGQFKDFCFSRQSGDDMAADFEVSETHTCPNTTVTFSDASIGASGATYDWNFGEGASPATATGAGPHDVTYSTSGYKDISLTLNGTNCGKERRILIDSVPNRYPVIEGDTLLCLGDEMVPFTAERMDDVILYHWTLPSGLTLQTGDLSRSIRANVEAGDGYIGDITMRPEYMCGIADPITPLPVYVYATPDPAVDILGDPPACGMGPATFSVDDVTYATEYTWISDNQIQLPNPPVTGPEVTATVNGSGRIGIIAQNTCGNSDTLWRYINMGAPWAVLDDVDIIGEFEDICPGDTVPYLVEQPNATIFDWTVPSGATIIRGQGTQEIFVVFDGTPGKITVDMDNDCNPSASPKTAELDILSFLTGTPPPSDITLTGPTCEGATVTLAVDPTASTLTWDVPFGYTIVSGQGTNEIEVEIGSADGEISVTATSGCGASTPSTIDITVEGAVADADLEGEIAVCAGTTGVTYTLNPSPGAASYTWSVPAGASIASGDGTESITVDFGSTDGDVSVTYPAGCGGDETKSLTITLSTATDVSALEGETDICAGTTGEAYALNPAPVGSGYTWTLPAGSTIASGDGTEAITVDFGSTAGDIVVNYDDACGNEVSKTLTIALSSAEDLSTLEGDEGICENATGIEYALNPSPGGSGYTWTLPAGASIASGDGTETITVDFGTTGGTIEVDYLDACGSPVNKTIDVTASGLQPAGAITGDVEVCANATGIVYSIDAVAGANSYTWNVPSDATITDGDGTESITVDFGTTIDQISVSPEFQCGTGDSAYVDLTEKIVPEAGAISGPAGLCIESTGVGYSIDAVAGATSYTWSVPTEATLVSGDGTTSIVVDYGSTPFNGTISVTPVGDCGDGVPSELAIAVGDGLTVTAITGHDVVCPSETGVTYTVDELLSATNYEWTVPAGATIASGAGTMTITVDFGPVGGTISVYAEGDCIDPIPVEFEVTTSDAPDAFTIDGTAEVCEGAEGTYSISPIFDDGSFNWSLPTGANVTGGNGVDEAVVTFGTESGTIEVDRINSCGVSSTETFDVTVINTITAGAITGEIEVCENSAGIPYSIDPVAGATDYAWTLPAGASIASGDGTNSILVDFATTSGTIEVTPSGSCGDGISATLDVTMKTPTAPGTITGPTEFCPSAAGVTYEVASVDGATDYQWVVPSDASIVSGQGTTTITVDFGSADGSIQVIVDGECVDQSPVSIPVGATDALQARNISGSTTICSGGGEETYSISPVATATNYTWSVPAGATILTGQGTTSISVDLGTVTSGNIEVFASGGCVEETPAVLAFEVVEAAGAGPITGETELCEGETGVYSIDPVPSATSYDWSIPLGATIISGAGTNMVTVLMGNSTGDVSVTPTGGCAIETAVDYPVTVSPLPATGDILGPVKVCKGSTGVQYEVQSSIYSDAYYWTVPTQATITEGQGSNSIFVDYGALGGNVTIKGVNECGNGVASVLMVSTALPGEVVTDFDGNEYTCEEFDLIIPNLITPNGDGYNDTWIIDNLDFVGYYTLEIYNRNGHLIYSTNSYDHRWDGTWEDRLVPETSYYYVITVKLGDQEYKGSISVIRE